MPKTLHILNGDATKVIFEKSRLKGDLLIWREMLCEGALDKEVGTDAFWKKRYTFFEDEVGVSKLDYFDKSLKEILKIENIGNYEAVVLWFEYDLFCQINLLGAMAFLLKYYQKHIKFYLVCTGREKGNQDWKSLSDYSPEQYNFLYENRIKLSRNDLLFAKEAWDVYVTNNPTDLVAFPFDKNKKLAYLQLAIRQHLHRFPKENGCNQQEEKLLEIIGENQFNHHEIIREILRWQNKETVYGFGDLQYDLILSALEKYYTIKEGIYSLNALGKEKLK